MITFNELKISKENKNMLVDISVDDIPALKDVFIEAVIIDTQDTYSPEGPSNTPVYIYQVPEVAPGNYPYPQEDIKNLRLCIKEEELKSGLDNLFFIYVITKGKPLTADFCINKDYSMASLCDLSSIYRKAMGYIKDPNGCNDSVSMEFIDFILKVKAFSLCITTGNYYKAIEYWNKFFKKSKDSELDNC